MKAIAYNEFKDSNNLELKDFPKPKPADGEVLIQVKATSVNPVDDLVRKGGMKSMLDYEFPVIPGWDVAGVVEEKGLGATRFNVGDEVIAYARRSLVHSGTYAEYISIPESYLALAPNNVSFEEAATIPLVGLTAFQGLIEMGDLKEGQKVLIIGASGGVGSFAIQFAKNEGAFVYAVASEANQNFIKEYGADVAINYNAEDFVETVKAQEPAGIDLVFDLAGGEATKKGIQVLKSGGTLVSVLTPEIDQHLVQENDINYKYLFVQPNSKQLALIAGMVETGVVKVPLTKIYKLSEAEKALNDLETGHNPGKIAISIT